MLGLVRCCPPTLAWLGLASGACPCHWEELGTGIWQGSALHCCEFRLPLPKDDDVRKENDSWRKTSKPQRICWSWSGTRRPWPPMKWENGSGPMVGPTQRKQWQPGARPSSSQKRRPAGSRQNRTSSTPWTSSRASMARDTHWQPLSIWMLLARRHPARMARCRTSCLRLVPY